MEKTFKISSISSLAFLLLLGLLILFHINRIEKQVLPLQHELAGLRPVRAIIKFEIELVQSSKTGNAKTIATRWKNLRDKNFGGTYDRGLQWNLEIFDKVEFHIDHFIRQPHGASLHSVFNALNELVLSLADESELILDPNLTRYHLIELLTRTVPEAITNIYFSRVVPRQAVNIEKIQHSLAVPGIPSSVKDVAQQFIEARSTREALHALDIMSDHLTFTIQDLLQVQIHENRLSEGFAISIGILAILICLLLNKALVLNTTAYLDPLRHAQRAIKSICLMAILSSAFAILVWPSEVYRWPYYLNISVVIGILLIFQIVKRVSLLVIWGAIFVVVGLVFFAATLTAVQGVNSGDRFQIFLAFKLSPLVLAFLAPPPAVISLCLILASGLIPIVEYFVLFSPSMRSMVPAGEPWLALMYACISIVIYLYRKRETQIERELIQAIDEKKTAEKLLRSESRFRRLAECNILGVVHSTINGEVIDANQYFLALLGYSLEDLKIGRIRLTEITAPECRESQLKYLQQILNQGSVPPYEKSYIRKDGERVWVLVGAALLEGASNELIIFVLDTTEKKRSEEALKKEREILLVKETHAREEAEKTVKLRNDFIALASHELRTPLTPLKGLIHINKKLMTSNVFATIPEVTQVLEIIDRCKLQVDRIHRLAEAMLTVTQIDTGEIELNRKTSDLSELIRHVLDQYQNDLDRARCALTLQIPADIKGYWDQEKLEQVLGNLLQNAIKFGPNRSIEIIATPFENKVRIAIRDHGIGLTEDLESNHYIRFQRNVPIESYGGLGLGLYIAKHITEAHGGAIFGMGKPGEGATFTVELPISRDDDFAKTFS